MRPQADSKPTTFVALVIQDGLPRISNPILSVEGRWKRCRAAQTRSALEPQNQLRGRVLSALVSALSLGTSAELRVLSSILLISLSGSGEHCRCGFNSAVQLIAVLPDVRAYLNQLCRSCDGSLMLHRALEKQLAELAAAYAADEVASLDGFLSALDKVAGLPSFLAKRSARQDLSSALQGTCQVSLSLCRSSPDLLGTADEICNFMAAPLSTTDTQASTMYWILQGWSTDRARGSQ